MGAAADAPWPSLWIVRFLSRPENAFMCVVDELFIRDGFNLYGLDEAVPGYQAAVRIVLGDLDLDSDGGGGRPSRVRRRVTPTAAAAELLYGLTHARYVMTEPGAAKMLVKYEAGCFGRCPRINCKRSHVLPVGLHDEARQDTVKLYCPRCMDVYEPEAGTIGTSVDGAYFGTGFPQMLFMIQPTARPGRSDGRYSCRLYGFRIHKSAIELQRYAATMKQLNQTKLLSQTTSRPNTTSVLSTTNIAGVDDRLLPTTTNVNVTAGWSATTPISATGRPVTIERTRSAAITTTNTVRK